MSGVFVRLNRPGAIALGACTGLAAFLILLVVPIAGVRGLGGFDQLDKIIGCWQEMVFLFTTMLASTIAGARLGRNRHIAANSMTAGKLSFSLDEDHNDQESERHEKPTLFSRLISGRTPVIAAVLYLVLYINCCILCQKLHLGVVDIPSINETIKSVGVAFILAGLHFILTNLPRKATDPTLSELSRLSLMAEAEASHAHHVPATSWTFFSGHPICLGWMLLLTGLPLIYLAWFPLIAMPGIFIAMNWIFGGQKEPI
ncbi:MAG: hypothetical protein KC777_02775 [Cyanobacteria bacterium HKST-UBA02]|nr:hypothetical protein [Cyanobacteria bacterium HKST-UBA02]